MSEKIYGSEGFCNARTAFKKEGKLVVEVVKNGIIYPKDKDEVWAKYKNQFGKGYVLDENKRWVNISGDRDQTIGGRGDVQEIASDTVVKKHKKAVYLGGCHNQWGHFLIEGLSRVWAILESDKYKDYELCYILSKATSFPSYMKEIFTLSGIDYTRINLIETPTMYDEVVVPQISSKLDTFWTDEYVATINKIKSNVTSVQGGKYYLSRTAFSDNIIGETVLEDIFRKNGYEIISPEQLSATEQIAIFSGADEIASISGSAAHSMVFMKDTANGIVLERMSFPNRTQAVIDDMLKAEISVIKANHSFLIFNVGMGPFLMALTPWLKQFFDEHHFVYDKNDEKAHYKFIYSYAKLWVNTYQNEGGRGLLRHNPKVTETEVQNLVTKVARAVEQAKDKTCIDKITRTKIMEDCCRVDIYTRDVTVENPFDLKVKQNGRDICVSKTSWMQNWGLVGYSLEVMEQKLHLELSVKVDCKLEICLRGPWKLKDEKDRTKGLVEFWIDYNKFSIDGKDILTAPVSAWHDKPFNYVVEVHKGDNLQIDVDWEKHKTLEERLSLKTKELTEVKNVNERAMKDMDDLKRVNHELVGQIQSLRGALLDISNQSGFSVNKKRVKGNFWYKRVETDIYVKTYICGICTRKRPANVCKFLDSRLCELEKRLKAHITREISQHDSRIIS